MISTNFTGKQLTYRLSGIAGALITLAIPYVIHTQHTGQELISEQSYCPFKMLTGFPCPGCGFTKSLIFLYEGNWIQSLKQHIFGPVVFLFCVGLIVLLTAELLAGKTWFRKWLYSTKLAYALGIVLAVYHLIRLTTFISQNNFGSILEQSIWR